MRAALEELAALFLVYSFLGWIIESTFKTIRRGQGFVNSGLLYGPVVPIYGCGALLIMLFDDATTGLVLPVRLLVLTLICAVLEYLVGWFFEAVFKTRLWDYSHKRFNIQGRVCLSFTLAWAALAALFIYLIRPESELLADGFLRLAWARYAVAAAMAIFVVDAAFSFRSLIITSSIIGKLRANARLRVSALQRGAADRLEGLQDFDLSSLTGSVRGIGRRLFRAFPHLEKLGAEGLGLDLVRLSRDVSAEGQSFAKAMQALRTRPSSGEGLDPEYLAIVEDILADEAVQSMGSISHHDDSVLRHSLTVSLVSYYIALALGFDAVATARGALLHDFFLYDWRKTKGRHHPTTHPSTALANARERFALKPIEEDIILTHMWPVARPFYAYKESFLVSSVDKIVSTKEAARLVADTAKSML
jgi:Predicted membrane protein